MLTELILMYLVDWGVKMLKNWISKHHLRHSHSHSFDEEEAFYKLSEEKRVSPTWNTLLCDIVNVFILILN